MRSSNITRGTNIRSPRIVAVSQLVQPPGSLLSLRLRFATCFAQQVSRAVLNDQAAFTLPLERRFAVVLPLRLSLLTVLLQDIFVYHVGQCIYLASNAASFPMLHNNLMCIVSIIFFNCKLTALAICLQISHG